MCIKVSGIQIPIVTNPFWENFRCLRNCPATDPPTKQAKSATDVVGYGCSFACYCRKEARKNITILRIHIYTYIYTYYTIREGAFESGEMRAVSAPALPA